MCLGHLILHVRSCSSPTMATSTYFPIISKHPAFIHRSDNSRPRQSEPVPLASSARDATLIPSSYASTHTTNNNIYADSRFIRNGFTSTDSLDWAYYKLQLDSLPANYQRVGGHHNTSSSPPPCYYHCPTRNADVEIARSMGFKFQYEQAVRSALQTLEPASAPASSVFSYGNLPASTTSVPSLRFAASLETMLQSASPTTSSSTPAVVQPLATVRDLPYCMPNPRWQPISLNHTQNAIAISLDNCAWFWNFTEGETGIRKVFTLKFFHL